MDVLLEILKNNGGWACLLFAIIFFIFRCKIDLRFTWGETLQFHIVFPAK